MPRTVAVISVFVLGLIAYDIWTISVIGYESTVSWTMYSWSQRFPVISFAVGFVMGHLFWPNAKISNPDTVKSNSAP